MRLKVACCILASILAACSPGRSPHDQARSETSIPQQQAVDTPPGFVVAAIQSEIEMLPRQVSRNETLRLSSETINLDEASIEWLVNGVPALQAASANFIVKQARKGDRIQARARYNGRDIFSNMVVVHNAFPEFTKIKIMPEVFGPGDTLYVDAEADDADGDEVTIAYAWERNGESAGTAKAIGLPIKRGDKVAVRLTASDPTGKGQSVELKREIQNIPPQIDDKIASSCEENFCSFTVSASDPDGDDLVFSLKKGLSGMTIQSDTGFVQWMMPSTFSGAETITVEVSDRHGGVASKDFRISR
jgi:hypothetical protein